MRKLTAALGLEASAFLLACMQMLAGVRTDEAKYLLNIPYPHPPLVRMMMSATEAIAFQEFLWRFLLASLFIQAAWLVWDMGRTLRYPERLVLCGAWLLSGSILLLSGSILLAPVNALQALVFLWLLSRPRLAENIPGWIALFWIASLFTAYQAVLYLPLVVALFWRMKLPCPRRLLYIFAPILLLALYTLGNPLAVASITHHGGEDLHSSLAHRSFDTLRLWLIAGSGIGSIAGTIGLIFSKRWEMIASFALVCAFVLLNRFDYYSILFTPLLIAGLSVLFARKRLPPLPFFVLLLAGTLVTLLLNPITTVPSPARAVMAAIAARHGSGDILIDASYGHEWEYESRLPLRRYKPAFLPHAQAVVCFEHCPRMPSSWVPLPELPVTVWVKR
jgi:hypothetical protein